jgi:hypothetical protein
VGWDRTNGKKEKGEHDMKRNFANIRGEPNRLFAQLMAEKKKTAVALCLITVMALMWARVLGKKTAEGAEALVKIEQLNAEALNASVNSKPKRSSAQLPKVKSRNDTLTRDFFVSNGWQDFAKGSQGRGSAIKEVSVVSKEGSEEVVRRVAGKLNLQAILSAENPQVFINDKMLSVGGKLVIREGVDTFECEVVDIQENKVCIRFEDARITLKLARAEEVSE